MTGPGGMLPTLVKSVLERGMAAELTGHPWLPPITTRPATPCGNSRNGYRARVLDSEIGPVELAVPRDRNGSLPTVLAPKSARRMGGLDEMVISLYAGGMTVRDIQYHLESTIGTQLSHETIPRHHRGRRRRGQDLAVTPVGGVLPGGLFLDALVVKVRDGAHVTNKSAHIAVGVDLAGVTHGARGSGCSPGRARSSGRGCAHNWPTGACGTSLIVCCDGLVGLPEAITATFGQTTIQTCVVHPGPGQHAVRVLRRP